MHSELHQDVLHMAARRVNRDIEQAGHLLVGPSLRKELRDCDLTRRELEPNREPLEGPAPGRGTLDHHHRHRTAAEPPPDRLAHCARHRMPSWCEARTV